MRAFHLQGEEIVAAEAAGFTDQNYFARWFKKQTGVTPMAWRASEAARR